MSVINQYLNELARCEMSSFDDSKSVEAHIYNGIDGMRGRDYYFGYLTKQHEQALNEIQDIVLNTDAKKVATILAMLFQRINVVIENIENFEVPSSVTIKLMQNDCDRSGNNIAMKNELDRMKFFSEMAAVQMYYASEFKKFLVRILNPITLTNIAHMDAPESMSSPQLDPETSTQAIHTPIKEEKYVYGLAGLMTLLKCGKNKAQSIVNSGKISSATSKDGRKYIFEVGKVMELLRMDNSTKSARKR